MFPKPRTCIYFRCHHPAPANTTINGQDAETVKSFKYLGIISDDKPTFDNNTDMLIQEKPAASFLSEEASQVPGGQISDDNVL